MRGIHDYIAKNAKKRVMHNDARLGNTTKPHEHSPLRGIRQPYPTQDTQFSALKAQVASDFIGGAAQGYSYNQYRENLESTAKAQQDYLDLLNSSTRGTKEFASSLSAHGMFGQQPSNLPRVHRFPSPNVSDYDHMPVFDPGPPVSTKPPFPQVRSPLPRNDWVNYYVDLETVDIRSAFKSKHKAFRPLNEPIGILEIAAFKERPKGISIYPMQSATGYTSILTKAILQQQSVYSHEDIPQSFLDTLTTHEINGPGSRFSADLAAQPNKDNTLYRVLQRQVQATLSGKMPGTDRPAGLKGTDQYLEGLVRAWEKDISQGKGVVFKAWNPSFDLSVILENAFTTGGEQLQKRFLSIVGDKSLFQIQDLSDPVKQAVIDRMMQDRRYSPSFINPREVETALSQGVTERELLQAVQRGKSPYIERNEALRSFWNDVIDYRSRTEDPKSVFRGRLLRAYMNKDVDLNINRGAVNEVVNVISGEFEKIATATPGQELAAYRRAVGNLREHRLHGYISKFIQGTYGGGGRISLFGEQIHHLGPRPQLFNSFATGMDMISGWAHDAWSSVAAGPKNQKDNAHIAYYDVLSSRQTSERVKALNLLAQGVHPASATHPSKFRQVSVDELSVLDQWFKEGEKSPGQYKTMQERAQATLAGYMDRATRESQAKRVKALGGRNKEVGIEVPEPKVSKQTKQTIANIASKRSLGKKGDLWLKGAAVASGLYLLSDWNRGSQVQGLRDPDSMHNQIEGLSPSGDLLFGHFGSGRNQLLQLLETAQFSNTNTLRASSLGYRGSHLQMMLQGQDPIGLDGVAERGTRIHELVQNIYMAEGLAQNVEHTVYDPRLDIVGHIDILLPSGVPLEIKSVEDYDALQKLNEPRDPHVSQANFYAYAMNQPYALIGYVARNNPEVIKYFQVNTDMERLYRDVGAVRMTLENLRAEGKVLRNYSLAQNVTDTLDIYRREYVHPVMTAPFTWPGMIVEPIFDAVKSLGDYKKHRISSTYRQERPCLDTVQCTGRAKVRDHSSKCFVKGPVTPPRHTMNLESRSLSYSNGLC